MVEPAAGAARLAADHTVIGLDRTGNKLASARPGFVFEPPDRLRGSLVLIGDLESRRDERERRFPLLPNPRA